MDINFVTDVMLVILVVFWTMMIGMFQIINFSTKSKVPLEMFGKILNLFVHTLLIIAMWLAIITPGSTIGWILILFGFLFFVLWFIISRYQNRYIRRQIAILKKEINKTMKNIEELENENKKAEASRRTKNKNK